MRTCTTTGSIGWTEVSSAVSGRTEVVVSAAGLIRATYETLASRQAGAYLISPLTPSPSESGIGAMDNGSTDKPSLTGAERSKLRSLAQTLDPKVFVGKAGINEGIAKLLLQAFEKADLVKVRFTAERDVMETQMQELARLTGSEVIGNVGRTATFFKLAEVAEDDGE
jgi:RNA-binding protein